ncbi:MAG: Sec-independent protein translocase subunit TatA [Jatrophihabitantaceae bacterium]
MGWEAPWHWVILAVIVIALFGYKKLPDAARSLGRSLRIFKTEIKGMGEDDAARNAAKANPTQTAPPALPAAPPAQPADAGAPAVAANLDKPAASAE